MLLKEQLGNEEYGAEGNSQRTEPARRSASELRALSAADRRRILEEQAKEAAAIYSDRRNIVSGGEELL